MTVTLADGAYRSVRDEILRGTLRPGMPLSRRRLARQLGMSVLPISDALRRLEEDGLVESRARAGTRVRIPTETDVRELYELREALEAQTARLFAQRATPGQRREIRQLAEQVDSLFERMTADGGEPVEPFDVHSRHVEFHMRIAEYAGSRLVTRMIERKHVLILNWLFDLAGRRTPLPAGFHSRLADALLSDDPDRADAVMRSHVRFGLPEVAAHIGALGASEWREKRRAG